MGGFHLLGHAGNVGVVACGSTRQNADGVYGAHFWLNANGKYPNIPRDLYSVNGFQGQRIFIIPSKDLVVVRTGLEEQTDEQFNTLLKEIIRSIR